ncbi:MAG TPA: contractile injection system tape measure protein [Flavobacterium sp.]|nr:contractile injection system tape measure protein [Flavobacterium sp.]
MYLIQQNSFDIQCSSQTFGMELQQQLSNLLEKTFYPQLEQLLVKYDVPGSHWIIDLLEVEVPDISKKYWKEELIQKALMQIEEYLIRNSPKTDLQIAELLGNNTYTIPSEEKAKLLVFDFLRNGFLPLNAFSDKIEKIIAGIVIDKNFVNQLLEFFQSDLKMVMRWIFSIPEEYKVKVLAFLPSSFNGLQFTKIILKEPVFQENKMKTIVEKLFSNPKHIQYWYELIQWADNIMRNGVSPQEVFSFLNHSMEKYWNTSKAEINQLFELALQKGNTNDADVAFFKLWQKQLDEKGIDEASDVTAESKVMNALLEQLQNGKTFSEGAVFYVNNAGLVILHPFLSTLFEKLELTKSNEWISEHAKQKAVLLTHYLVFGEQEIEENQLILNKILCGLPIEEVVNTQIILETEDKETCMNLLDAVLEHWSIMKNSSKEALQETFLQREGKLEIQINGFEMWMEEKGYDILLEQLPWGIGMIRTPWMEYYLICNWNQ